MQLADSAEADGGNHELWFATQRQRVAEFSGEIEACLITADWDALGEVLDRRQGFFQQLFNQASPPVCQAFLRQLASEVLAEDADFVARIEVEKHAIAQQHQSFEHSRKALKAYSEF